MSHEAGIIGLGLIGSAVAEILLHQGWRVSGCDVDPARGRWLESQGGSVQASPRALGRAAGIVITALLTDEITEQVLFGPEGVTQADPRPRLVLHFGTGTPDFSARMGEALATHGIAWIEAPILGSSRQVREQTAHLLVGASDAALAVGRPLLDALDLPWRHLGKPGAAARAKLAVNLVLGLNRLALAESLLFAEQVGLDPATLLEILVDSPAYSRAMDTKGPRMIEGRFAPPDARLAQHAKDVGLILEEAARHQMPLPASALHAELLAAAIAAGDGELDNAAIIRQLRRMQLSDLP